MKNAKFTHILILVCLLLIVAGAIFALTCTLLPNLNVVFAQDLPHFTISSPDGYNWTLAKNGVLVNQFEGDFYEYGNPEVVGVKMYDAIRTQLIIDGIIEEDMPYGDSLHEYYTIEFVLSGAHTSLLGTDTAKYTQQNDSPIIVRGACDYNIASSGTYVIEYRPVGATAFTPCIAEIVSQGSLRFGQNIPVGDYQVRINIIEEFSFDQNQCTAVHYGNTVACHITIADAVAPQNAVASIEYGTSIGQIARSISAEYGIVGSGVWTLSATQTEEALSSASENTFLQPREQAYQVLFDFAPYNANYKSSSGVAVDVTVSKKHVAVYVEDAFSLVGEELVDISTLSYYINELDLVAGDTIADLGVSLSCEGLTNETAGVYTVVAMFANPFYIADSRNFNSHFVDGGRYRVYSKKIVVVADDGMEFEIFCNDGILQNIIRIETCEDYEGNGREVVKAYHFVFKEYENADLVPPAEYTVSWAQSVEGALFVANEDGVLLDARTTHSLNMVDGKQYVVFYGDIIREYGGSLLTPKNIALICVSCVLACAVIGVVVAYLRRRRYM